MMAPASSAIDINLRFVLLQRSAINEPTWTGHSGAAGAPAAAASPRPRFGAAANPAIRRHLVPPGGSGSLQSASAGAGAGSSDAGGRVSPGGGSTGQQRFGGTGIAGVSGACPWRWKHLRLLSEYMLTRNNCILHKPPRAFTTAVADCVWHT